jgi:hypothetical protein
MRSKEFKRTPFTDWMDSLDQICVECGIKLNVDEISYGHDCEAA